MVLSTHGGSDVASLHLPIRSEHLVRVGERRWESRQLPTSTHSMVAFTWDAGQRAPGVQIRSRRSGAWGSWSSARALHDVPETVAGRAAETVGTELLWIGRADGIQLRVQGDRPTGFTLVLLHPGRRSSDRTLGGSGVGIGTRLLGRAASSGVEQPRLVSRREWGADESLRNSDPTYIHTIKQVHVHHTANSNTYERDDVPALLRGMYAYHTRSLGWSDIGYNFLVDRFGRCWVGRAGGAARLVRGSHTLGFNAESTGIAAIGNYDTQAPTGALLDGIAAIAAWKLYPFKRDAAGEIRVQSEGSDRYSTGRAAVLPVIDGHRDTNDTACPGRYLYEALPKVRARTERIMAAAAPLATITVEQAAVLTGVPQLGSTLSVAPGAYQPRDVSVGYQWLRGGQPIRRARDRNYTTRPQDVGSVLTCQVTTSRTGYAPLAQSLTASGPVTATPTLAVEVDTRRGVARVRVTVAGPQGTPVRPAGQVTVKLGKRSATLTLKDGRAVARFGGNHALPAGRYAVRAAYAGDATFVAAREKTSVNIG